MFTDPYFQAELARQRQADIRAAADAARTARVRRLMRREARRAGRATKVSAARPSPFPATVVSVSR